MFRSAQWRHPVSLAAVLTVLLVGCGPRREAPVALEPRLRVLGTVQDGGLPHAACTCANCEAARRDPRRRRFVASLALLLPQPQRKTAVYLVDATPDIRDQLTQSRDAQHDPAGGVDRAPVDGVFLTHAHIGHYLGLAFFGFEAVNTKDLPVYCTPRMAAFLRGNGPWSQLVWIGNISLRELPPVATVELPFGDGGDCIAVTPIQVPHRDEYSDTVGYVFRRPARPMASASLPRSAVPPLPRTVLYVPDTAPWRTWSPSVTEVIERERVDVLLVDGTFYSPGELPGRSVASIGHPLMTDSMTLLAPLVAAGRLRVLFTHLNHSNPALNPASEASHSIRLRGFEIVSEGDEIAL